MFLLLFLSFCPLQLSAGPSAASDALIMRPAKGIEAPRLTHKTSPKYSKEALQAHAEGSVLIGLVVDREGFPRDIRVIRAIGFGLDERAVETVGEWRFRPARLQTEPIPVRAAAQVNFEFGDKFVEKHDYELQVIRLVSDLANLKGAERPTDKQIKQVMTFADENAAPAQFVCGRWKYEGKILTKDQAQGIALLTRSASQNYGPALFYLSQLVSAGAVSPDGAARARQLMEQAAAFGSSDAQHILAGMYESGDQVQSNPDRALEYFRLCAGAGDVQCEFALGKDLLDSSTKDESQVFEAVAWLQVAAQSGQAQARAIVETQKAMFNEDQVYWVDELSRLLRAVVPFGR